MTTSVDAVVRQIEALPDGSLVYYRRQPYFVSRGVDARIVTGKDGCWQFIHKLKWKTVRVVHVAGQGNQ